MEVGTVKLTFDSEGKVTSAKFESNIDLTEKMIIDDLKKIQSSDDEESIKDNASLILAAAFTNMNQAELSDPNEKVLRSDIIKCDKLADRVCEVWIRFTLEPR